MSLSNSSLSSTSDLGPLHADGSVRSLAQSAPTGAVVVETLTMVVLWASSVLGNTLVCLVVRRSRRIQSTTNYFVVTLALVDLALSLCCLPFVAARVIAGPWPSGRFLCKLVRFMQHAAPAASVFVLVSISIDRYYTIIYPLSFRVTRGTAKRMIGFSLSAAVLLSALCFYFFDVQWVLVAHDYDQGYHSSTSAAGGVGGGDADGGGSGGGSQNAVGVELLHLTTTASSSGVYYVSVCPTFVPCADGSWGGRAYLASVVLGHYFLPVLLLAGLYGRLGAHIWALGPTGSGRALQRTANPVPRTKVRMVRMLLMVTCFCLALLAPSYISQVAYCLQPTRPMDRGVFVGAFWCLAAACPIKPLLYLYYNANFRRGCKEVFCMSAMRCYRSNTYAITSASMFGKKNYVGAMEMSGNSSCLPCDSPLKAFNRALYADRNTWPLGGSLPSYT